MKHIKHLLSFSNFEAGLEIQIKHFPNFKGFYNEIVAKLNGTYPHPYLSRYRSQRRKKQIHLLKSILPFLCISDDQFYLIRNKM